MRRWFEFGWDGNIATPTWSLNSNRRKSGPRPQGIGDLPAVFVQMPYKEDMLNILQGTSYASEQPNSRVLATIVGGGSTAAPLTNANAGDNCEAEHVVPAGLNPYGWQIHRLFTGGPWQWILGGFPTADGFSFTVPLIRIFDEPPSENG